MMIGFRIGLPSSSSVLASACFKPGFYESDGAEQCGLLRSLVKAFSPTSSGFWILLAGCATALLASRHGMKGIREDGCGFRSPRVLSCA